MTPARTTQQPDRTASIGPSHAFVMSALTLRTRRHPTQTGHPDFPEAAAEARGPSVSFAATKLPFVTSQLRPSGVVRRSNLSGRFRLEADALASCTIAAYDGAGPARSVELVLTLFLAPCAGRSSSPSERKRSRRSPSRSGHISQQLRVIEIHSRRADHRQSPRGPVFMR